MKRAFVLAAAAITASLAVPAARAEILPCGERDVSDYEHVGYSKKHRQIAFRRIWGVCARDSPESENGTFHRFETIEVYTHAGKLKRKFLWTGPKEIEKQLAEDKVHGDLEAMLKGALPRAKIEHYLEVGKFRKLKSRSKSPSGGCRIEVKLGKEEEEGDVVPMRTARLTLRQGDGEKPLATFKTSARDVKAAIYWYRAPRVALLVRQLKVWHPGSGHCCDYQELKFLEVPAECY